MRIPERDVTYIVLSAYLLTLTCPIKHKMNHTQVKIQLKTSELELDFTDIYSTLSYGLQIFAGPLIVYHV